MAVVQYTFTHKQYTEQHKQDTQNRTYITMRIHKHNEITQFTKLKMIVKLFI